LVFSESLLLSDKIFASCDFLVHRDSQTGRFHNELRHSFLNHLPALFVTPETFARSGFLFRPEQQLTFGPDSNGERNPLSLSGSAFP
jgi:hypothetical protein